MPKKQRNETPDDQYARFKAEVEKLIAAGELSPTEADERLDSILRKSAPTAGEHPE